MAFGGALAGGIIGGGLGLLGGWLGGRAAARRETRDLRNTVNAQNNSIANLNTRVGGLETNTNVLTGALSRLNYAVPQYQVPVFQSYQPPVYTQPVYAPIYNQPTYIAPQQVAYGGSQHPTYAQTWPTSLIDGGAGQQVFISNGDQHFYANPYGGHSPVAQPTTPWYAPVLAQSQMGNSYVPQQVFISNGNQYFYDDPYQLAPYDHSYQAATPWPTLQMTNRVGLPSQTNIGIQVYS